MKIAIAAGGTGGHIYPGIAIAEELRAIDPENELLFIGSYEGLEGNIVKHEGFEIKLIHARALLRKISYKAISAPFMTIIAFFEAIYILLSFKPEMLVVTGGYVSFPVICAAVILRIPFLLHEENVLPGITNRIWHRFARVVTLSFEETLEYMDGTVTGNPVRKRILSAKRKTSEKKTVAIIGGSQGAKSINKAVVSQLKNLEDYKIFHIIGNRDYDKITEFVEYANYPFYHPLSYVNNIEEVLAQSDLVVSRAGATAISEILALGLPSILVPFPYSAEGHQNLNADVLVNAGAAHVLPDSKLKKLSSEISSILSNEDELKNMREAAAKIVKKGAAREIVKLIYDLS
jgi:UDP-N-acetylglucosamine--N-acetylmuramyl-(pentapeptide) pyrophosphoryl-undecaprenol N-acetylglucosamine transferase